MNHRPKSLPAIWVLDPWSDQKVTTGADRMQNHYFRHSGSIKIEKPAGMAGFSIMCKISGAGGSRTPVQTYPPKAFYMFIWLLFVGNEQGTGKPIHSLAGWS